MEYEAFLAAKAIRSVESGCEPGPVHESLYPFQQAIVEWAIRRGRAAVFADCGLGKTRIQLEWARQMGDRVLIVAPLCVADQTIQEGVDIGVDVQFAAQPFEDPGIWITNYEKLRKFVGVEYDAIVLDESSILKSLDGKTRTLLLREFTHIPCRLCCTATPAPNDIAELANHSEFLGIMSRVEMLASFFVHDSDGWRLKGHASDDFWRWMVTWGIYVRLPSDLGFEDGDFVLPDLRIDSLSVESDYVPQGMLFPVKLSGIQGRSEARKATLESRVQACADLIRSRTGPWIVWHGLNDEGTALARELGNLAVHIEGSTKDDQRESLHERWRHGDAQVLITKPSIFGWGMNWQHCAQMAFLGLGDSYESYYQAIRRCWRFGQENPVNVWIVTSTAEAEIVRNVQRKERDAAVLADGIVSHMRDLEIAEVRQASREVSDYTAEIPMEVPSWLMSS